LGFFFPQGNVVALLPKAKAAEGVEVLESAFECTLGGGLIAIEESELVIGFRGPEIYGRLGKIERGLDSVVSALLAPEEPAGESGVFDQAARLHGRGRVFFEQIAEQRVEIFTALAGDDEFFGSAAVRGGVAANNFFACGRDRSGLRVKFQR
jgi:hypothetical protein